METETLGDKRGEMFKRFKHACEAESSPVAALQVSRQSGTGHAQASPVGKMLSKSNKMVGANS
jgi:hypothetical protein